MVLGEESRQITDDERTWSGPFQTAHASAAGETTDANPTGHGQRHLARHSGDDGALLKILALGNRQIAAGQVKSATDVVGRLQERNQRR
ncbi:MAG: hypothetical protein TQ37_02305 [Candidatus Synechococcus spongiarum 15L]|uniref:Uncharacterized protein n=1 Tax=Candidatus Synechococcus spongiarum 15L TaxID=1608419 RepID=A0A0G8AY52_9SYNE|nr:MAG: hypothetical protein TQ37_02305 [Candidatus Synechococcus spongiarum 15L]